LKNNPKLSVCIPTYEMNGMGATYLEKSFGVLAKQTLDGFEVIVSDQSLNDDIKELCEVWQGRLNLRHYWNRDGERQASANTNHALKMARGAVHKVLFQDDFILSETALQEIFEAFDGLEAMWLLTGSGNTRDGQTIERPMVPHLTPKLHFGKNTVSSPSVLAIRASCEHQFDENLIWLMDVEFYARLWKNYGDPIILPETLVANRLHADQVSKSIDRAIQKRELDYVRKKFTSSTQMSGYLEYAKRRAKTLFR
jgi:glycosyltransferase involved in cell wall biosynthesis